MKKLFLLIFCWYAQDLAQILMSQSFLAPEIYAVALMWCATQQDEGDDPFRWVVASVVGGLLMDLRWLGVPGLCASLCTAAQFAARVAWFQVPPANRRMVPFLTIAACLCMLMTPFRLVFWDVCVLEGRIFLVVGAQWTLTAIVLLIFALFKPFSYEAQAEYGSRYDNESSL